MAKIFPFGQAKCALEHWRYSSIPFGHLKALCSLTEDTERQLWKSVYTFLKREVILHQWGLGIQIIYSELVPYNWKDKKTNLLIASETSVDSGVDDSIETHGQGVDVLHLPGLTLRNQRPQLQVLVLDDLNSILQWTHLHLEPKIKQGTSSQETMVEKSFHAMVGEF